MEVSSVQMCEDLFTLLRRVKAAMVEVADSYHMTPVQIAALYAILQGDRNMGQVAHKLHCDASNATGIIDRLVAQDLVVRKESEQDRRVKALHLTAKGEQVIKEIIVKLPDVLGCSKLSAQERGSMHDTICKLETN